MLLDKQITAELLHQERLLAYVFWSRADAGAVSYLWLTEKREWALDS